ncbi:hypothetical protein ESZ00_11775 [Silvibacterium dinghuense]|uniref:Uncharacterized protein n=2 Tax=Silvibacterium dinghuense TaxID=1560006 RepID=A0A4Q1SFC1_9BACT|nr:hypothetical protein ESZ00_11775 [Silvibacterium dinghuense]
MACRSAFIAADIRNDGDTPIRLIEVDYPSASFGTQLLAPHATYDYRFKVQGSGQISLSFTSNDGVSHTVKGPELIEGQEGRLSMAIDSANHVTWSERLMKAR